MGGYVVRSMSLSSLDWDEKISSFCHFSLRRVRNSFAVLKFRAAGDVQENGQET